MVQFLSVHFFSWISSIFVGFFKSSSFFVSPCIYLQHSQQMFQVTSSSLQPAHHQTYALCRTSKNLHNSPYINLAKRSHSIPFYTNVIKLVQKGEKKNDDETLYIKTSTFWIKYLIKKVGGSKYPLWYIVHSAAAATVSTVWASIMYVTEVQWSREFSVSFNVWELSTFSPNKCFLVYLSAFYLSFIYGDCTTSEAEFSGRHCCTFWCLSAVVYCCRETYMKQKRNIPNAKKRWN